MSYLVPTVIEVDEMRFARKRIEELLAHHTGQPESRIAADIERDYIVRGEAAVAYGLVDEVITQRDAVPTAAVAPGYCGVATVDGNS